MADILEHPHLIELALTTYLATLDPRPWKPSLTDPATGNLRIFAGENNLDKSGQNIVAFIDGDLSDEDPPGSGNRWADLIVRLRTPPAIAATAQETGSLEEHQATADSLQKALLDPTCETLAASLSAAISEFTCLGITTRTPFRAQDDTGWVTGWKLRLYSCPSALPT